MISKIYGSNKILFIKNSIKGKTKYQIALMVEQKKAKKYRDNAKIKWLKEKIREQSGNRKSNPKFNSNGTLNKYRNKKKRRKKWIYSSL